MTIRKKNKIEAKGSMLMLCATDAETIFFSQLRKDCRYSNLTVQKSSSDNLEKMLSEASSLRNRGKYSSVWCVFGLDEVNATIEDVARTEESAEKKRVRMLYFAPSFDLYFALFEMSPRKLVTKDELVRRCQAAFQGYELSARYFLTEGLNLNFKIYPRLAVADQNARQYNDIAEMDTGFKATTLSDFFDDLKAVCGKANMSQARNRF